MRKCQTERFALRKDSRLENAYPLTGRMINGYAATAWLTQPGDITTLLDMKGAPAAWPGHSSLRGR